MRAQPQSTSPRLAAGTVSTGRSYSSSSRETQHGPLPTAATLAGLEAIGSRGWRRTRRGITVEWKNREERGGGGATTPRKGGRRWLKRERETCDTCPRLTEAIGLHFTSALFGWA